MEQHLIKMFIMAQIAFGDLADRVRNGDDQRGATAVEYGLLVALIAGVIIATVTIFGNTIAGIFTSVNTKL